MKNTQILAASPKPSANEWLRRLEEEKASANGNNQAHYGKLLSPMNEPITRREFRTLVAILCQTDMYIKESEYIAMLGISRSTYWQWKKLGRLNNAFHPNSVGKKRLVNKFYNVNSGRIEIPGLNCTEPTKPARKCRKNNSKVAKNKVAAEAVKENEGGNEV